MADRAAAPLAQGIKKLTITVEIPGVPPRWSQFRGHTAFAAREKAVWREKAWMCAMSARNQAGWPPPVETMPPAPRFYETQVWEKRPFRDADNISYDLKPLRDGCFGKTLVEGRWVPGPLAWDDSTTWLRSLTGIDDLQVPVGTTAQEKVIFIVHLVDPRRPV